MKPASEFYVPKGYRRDPATEVLLAGDILRNGMVVLIANPQYRVMLEVIVDHDETWREIAIDHFTPGSSRKEWRGDEAWFAESTSQLVIRDALRYNRWCTVTDILRLDYSQEGSDDIIYFRGEYEDNSRFDFRIPVSESWYVKKASV